MLFCLQALLAEHPALMGFGSDANLRVDRWWEPDTTVEDAVRDLQEKNKLLEDKLQQILRLLEQ